MDWKKSKNFWQYQIKNDLQIFKCDLWQKWFIQTWRLKNAPLPYQAKAPYLINSEHYLAALIVNDIHTRFKHISIKQTLTELRQNFWICIGRQFEIFENVFLTKSSKDLVNNTQFHLRYPNYEWTMLLLFTLQE